jgi:hypothetical protein
VQLCANRENYACRLLMETTFKRRSSSSTDFCRRSMRGFLYLSKVNLVSVWPMIELRSASSPWNKVAKVLLHIRKVTSGMISR